MEEILRMQDNLLLIRRTVGWSAEELGDRIGVTRQTINNIENGRNKLTKTQYIALRSILDAEIIQSPEDTEMLRVLLEMFVDHPEAYEKEDRQRMLDQAKLIAPSILAGSATRQAVSAEMMKTAGMVAGGALVAAVAGMTTVPVMGCLSSAWLLKVISSAKRKK